MPITGEVVVPAAVYKTAIRVLSRRILIRLRLFGGVIAVLGLLIYAIDGNYVLAAPFVGAGLALALISPWRAVNATLKQAGPALAGPWRYSVGEEELSVTTPLATTQWPWKGVTAFEDHPDFWLLRTVMKNHGVIVVKAAFAEADRPLLAQRFRGWLGHQRDVPAA